jgi:hypothetical protein
LWICSSRVRGSKVRRFNLRFGEYGARDPDVYSIVLA